MNKLVRSASMIFGRWSRWIAVAWFALVSPRDAALAQERGAVLRANALMEAEASMDGTSHVLRVCNAYPDAGNLKIFSNDQELTSFTGLGYKSCQEWKGLHLQVGDILEFRLGGFSAGALRFSKVPWDNAVVAVVVYDVIRMTGRSFVSQVFKAGVAETQVAVFDAFHGGARAKTWIKDSGKNAYVRSEELHYDDAVVIQPGHYKLYLHTEEGQIVDQAPFVALNSESYIVIRCGGDGPNRDHAQELLVYPNSDESGLHAGSDVAPARMDMPEIDNPFPAPTKWEPPQARRATQGEPVQLADVLSAVAILLLFLVIGLLLHSMRAVA